MEKTLKITVWVLMVVAPTLAGAFMAISSVPENSPKEILMMFIFTPVIFMEAIVLGCYANEK